MNIVFTSDDNFVRQMATAILSLFEINKEEDIVVYILSKQISKENQQILLDLANEYGQKMQITELTDVETYFGNAIDTGGWNNIVLARLFIDRILPQDVHRVLYLDGDVVVRHSLRDLWNTDLQGNVLGMIQEPTIPKHRKEELGIDENGRYYNAGILLMDLDAWREKNAGERIVEFYKAHGCKLFANDQDAINGELKDEIYPLDLKYNYCNTYYFYPYSAILKMVKRDDYYSKEYYDTMIHDPYIVHYLGEERPWREGNRHIYRDDFVKYYNMTFYGKNSEKKDGIFEYGWKRYYMAWNIFNGIFRFFPMLRLKVINTLIPLILDLRRNKK